MRALDGHGGRGLPIPPSARQRVRGFRGSIAAGALGAVLGVPLPAAAHGLGQRYELPLPLGFYVTGAGVAVGLSFLLMAWFMRRGTAAGGGTVDLGGPFANGSSAAAGLRWTLRLGALATWAGLIVVGLVGPQQPFKNITPIAIWVLWWVGFAYLSAFVADLWPVVNPWATVYDLVRGRRPADRPLVTYPARWGVAPAVLAFAGFVAMELAWDQSEVPRSLALAMLGYSALTWIAMAVFGRDAWLARGELFSVYFAMLGRFAPLAMRAGNPHCGLIARPFAVGLLVERPVPPTMTLFVLLTLAAVTFDGLLDTPLWAAGIGGLRDWATGSPVASLSDAALTAVAWIAFAVVFILLYGGVARAMAWSAGEASSRPDLGGWFVLTLVPIGLAYHVAHYHSLLLVAGQYAVPLLSDPFGWGWDLFGTTLYRVDFSVVDAASMWYLSLGAIVAGHVVAVYLAHVMALRVYRNARIALRSQVPMLVLMVYYTMSSLWILSQPIVKTGN
jgi:hypothetical protein